MTTWAPNGKLDDGTLLFGPLREKPKDNEPVLAVNIDNTTWWVKYCCEKLTQEQETKVHAWAKKQIEKRASESKPHK